MTLHRAVLDDYETVCVPGPEGQAAVLDALLAAETALLSGGTRPSPAAR